MTRIKEERGSWIVIAQDYEQAMEARRQLDRFIPKSALMARAINEHSLIGNGVNIVWWTPKDEDRPPETSFAARQSELVIVLGERPDWAYVSEDIIKFNREARKTAIANLRKLKVVYPQMEFKLHCDRGRVWARCPGLSDPRSSFSVNLYDPDHKALRRALARYGLETWLEATYPHLKFSALPKADNPDIFRVGIWVRRLRVRLCQGSHQANGAGP
jgi:hypothetical protein